MTTQFTPEFIKQQREILSGTTHTGEFSWEFLAAGLKHTTGTSKYIATAANHYPAALDKIELLRADFAAANHLLEVYSDALVEILSAPGIEAACNIARKALEE
jgi:hypothetical protein